MLFRKALHHKNLPFLLHSVNIEQHYAFMYCKHGNNCCFIFRYKTASSILSGAALSSKHVSVLNSIFVLIHNVSRSNRSVWNEKVNITTAETFGNWPIESSDVGKNSLSAGICLQSVDLSSFFLPFVMTFNRQWHQQTLRTGDLGPYQHIQFRFSM